MVKGSNFGESWGEPLWNCADLYPYTIYMMTLTRHNAFPAHTVVKNNLTDFRNIDDVVNPSLKNSGVMSKDVDPIVYSGKDRQILDPEPTRQ
ncbi:hypothetical protein BDZ94DRAFT_900462 [Collybia nuda]|uniref:Uncharacterized protein n=1 Tax=Collybia nuda TaxID=64659 RepID=A0A9P5YFR3_9AGAR|nr:hypothetical protein BDZ94DRAFT_900462 [Collybia nuda]